MASTPTPTAKEKPSIWDKLDTPIEFRGRAITLPGEPEEMPLEKAIEALVRKAKDENQIFRVHEIIDASPFDGAVAFYKAMVKLYGWASPQTVMTFFGPNPPQMMSIKVGPGPGDVVQCPMGQFMLPGVNEPVNTTFGHNDKNQPSLIIYGEVKKKDRHILLELAVETRRIVKAESIYRGKPIRLGLDSDGDLDMSRAPEFLDVSEMTEASILFNQEITNQINTNLLVPLKETALCRQHKIPLKRGVLLSGTYGTGKSLTARLVARVAEENGWTFILLDNVSGLKEALEFALRYAPAVVFAEDIDRIASERDDDTNDLINTIDGVVSKGQEIITILTTNYVEKLAKVILRPGRLDAIITLKAPDAKTVERLLRYYAGPLLPESEDLTNSGLELAGQIPATIRECVEQSKLGMIGRRATVLADIDLVTAAQTMKNHLELLNEAEPVVSDAEKLAASLRAVIGNGNGSDDLNSRLGNIGNIADNARVHAHRAEVHAGAVRKKLQA